MEFNHKESGLETNSRVTVTAAGGGGPILVYDSFCRERVPHERRAQVAEYLVRVNAELPVGAFQMNWTDGEVRFRTSIDLRREELSDALLSGVVYPNHQATIDWFPHLLAVINGELGADEAFDEARNTIG